MKNEIKLNGLERFYVSLFPVKGIYLLRRLCQIGNLKPASQLKNKIFSYWFNIDESELHKLLQPKKYKQLQDKIDDWEGIKKSGQKDRIQNNIDIAEQHLIPLENEVKNLKIKFVEKNPHIRPLSRESPFLNFREKIDTSKTFLQGILAQSLTHYEGFSGLEEVASKFPETTIIKNWESHCLQLIRATGDKRLKDAYIKLQQAKISRFSPRKSTDKLVEDTFEILNQWKNDTLSNRMKSFLMALFEIIEFQTSDHKERFLQIAHEKAVMEENVINILLS